MNKLSKIVGLSLLLIPISGLLSMEGPAENPNKEQQSTCSSLVPFNSQMMLRPMSTIDSSTRIPALSGIDCQIEEILRAIRVLSLNPSHPVLGKVSSPENCFILGSLRRAQSEVDKSKKGSALYTELDKKELRYNSVSSAQQIQLLNLAHHLKFHDIAGYILYRLRLPIGEKSYVINNTWYTPPVGVYKEGYWNLKSCILNKPDYNPIPDILRQQKKLRNSLAPYNYSSKELIAMGVMPEATSALLLDHKKTALVCDAFTGTSIQIFSHSVPVKSMTLSPDQSKTAILEKELNARSECTYKVKVWDNSTKSLILEFQANDNYLVSSIDFSSNSKKVIIISSTHSVGQITLCDLKTGKVVKTFDCDGPICFARFISADGNKILFSRDTNCDCKAKILDVKLEKEDYSFTHSNSITSAAFSPTGNEIATASIDGIAKIWDVKTGLQIGSDIQHSDAVEYIEFSPDGKRVVTASSDKTAKIWDIDSKSQLGYDLKHQGVIFSAKFSPDGTKVVTASHDGTAKIWDVNTGKEIATLGHTEPLDLYSATFYCDGTKVVTVYSNGQALIWDVPTEQ